MGFIIELLPTNSNLSNCESDKNYGIPSLIIIGPTFHLYLHSFTNCFSSCSSELQAIR